MITTDKARELAAYFHTTTKAIITRYKAIEHLPGFVKWTHVSIDDWNKRQVNQKSRHEIEQWYNQQDNYVYELMEIYSQPAKLKISQEVLDFCKIKQVKTILDYGCGIGEESIRAAKAGFAPSMADIPSRTLEFARFRIKFHHLPVKVIEIHSDTPLDKQYDAATCFEVLPQVWNPRKIVRHLVAHLRPDGFLFLTVRFNMPINSAIVQKNIPFGKIYSRYIQNLGCRLLEKRYQYGEGKNAKYLEIYQKTRPHN